MGRRKLNGELRTCRKCAAMFEGRSCPHCALAYRVANREKINAVQDAYRKANLEKIKEMARERYAKNPDRQKIASQKWEAKNKQRIYQTKKRWSEANAEQIKIKRAEYNRGRREINRIIAAKRRAENPELHRYLVRKWRTENPLRVREIKQNRRAREISAKGKLSKGWVSRLLELQRGMCAVCRLSLGDDITLDHIMPLALGGTNEDSNIQLLHRKCNSTKHAKHPIDFMQSRGFLL